VLSLSAEQHASTPPAGRLVSISACQLAIGRRGCGLFEEAFDKESDSRSSADYEPTPKAEMLTC
jgi:hypothetical protein